MPKDQKPRRRRKDAAPKAEQVEPSGEVHPAPRPEVGVRARPAVTTPPIVARLAGVIRTVAVALIDIADAAAESLTKAVERRT